MGGTHTLNVLSGVAQDIGNLLHDVNGSDFKVTSISSPRQFDGYSCGVFVCHKIATLLDSSTSQDVSVTGLDNFRFRLLAYVLRGKKM
jgi:Ulp1 family protease